MSEELLELQQQKKGGLTPRELFLKYLRFLPWIIISLAVMMILAYVKLRYSIPIYSVSSKLIVKNPGTNGGTNEKFDDIFMMQSGRNNMNDEMEIIKSRNIAKRVITKLNFQYQYFNKGQFRSTSIHSNEMPFLAKIFALSDSTKGLGLTINVVNDNEFTIGETTQKRRFGDSIALGSFSFTLSRTAIGFSGFSSKVFVITWSPLENLAASLSDAIKLTKGDNFSNVISLKYETDNTSIGRDILNRYMEEYQQYNMEDKKQVAVNTLDFIDEQSDTVRKELGNVERVLKDFREQNKVIDPESQAKMNLENINESSRQITEQAVKAKVTEQLYNYVNDQKNPYRIVPSTLGIIEPTLVQQITEFNRLVLERETTLKTVPSGSPIIINLETGIQKLRSDILDNLRNIRKTYELTIRDFEKSNSFSEKEVRSLPGVQKRLIEINRRQKILEELYSFLLQKRLETSIGSASTISNIKVVEPAFSSNYPIRPDQNNIYLISIFFGLLIPVGGILVLEYLNDRIQTKKDVQKVTDAPILGEIGHSEDSSTLVVGKNNRKVVAEQFRMVRTNLQYILHDKKKMVIMVTSSFSGEGKSFISTNIAGVVALTGKKTVILEFDIRKPKIVYGLELKRTQGITNFIVGNCKVEDLPVPVAEHKNLFVIPCGPVPPNPAELLLDPKIDEIFNYAKKEFDVVVIDTAPVGLVSDAITLGKFADATVYIVRHNFTQKRQIQLVQDLYVSQKLPNMAVVINDIRIKLGYGGYYGYGGYGYGYGYGYGKKSSGYNEASAYYGQEENTSLTFGKWIRKLFRGKRK